MANSDSEREHRARLYTAQRQRTILKLLGSGTDGAVWQTTISTVVKACEDLPRYSTEKACYKLLLEKGVTEICGYKIPRLINYSDDDMVIEIGMVTPPFILDFGKASLHRLPRHYSMKDIEELYEQRSALFDDEWPTVHSILRRLRGYGIWHLDPRPHNIRPANWNPDC